MSQAKKASELPLATPSQLLGVSESGLSARFGLSGLTRRFAQAADLNECTTPGIYRFTSQLANRPEGVTTAGCTMIVESHTVNYAQQTLICSMWGSQGIYVRNMMAGKWCAWGKIEFTVVPSTKPEE